MAWSAAASAAASSLSLMASRCLAASSSPFLAARAYHLYASPGFLGMPKNPGEAYKWYALAAKNGDEEAAKQREAIKLKLDAAALAAADQAIAAWTAKEASAEANEVDEPQEWADASSAINTALVNRAQ